MTVSAGPCPGDGRSELETIEAALRASLGQAPDRAQAMPGAFYASERWAEVERERLFAREWICVGREDELPVPGDYLCVDVLEEPVVVVRGPDGVLRAMSTVCRHRATLVVEGRGNTDRFVCPYHNWIYDTTGRLVRAPLVDREDFDPAGCRLPPLALEVWLGFVFVHLEPEPEPLAPRLAGALELARSYHFEQMLTRYVSDEIWATNWKSLVENFMEGYHLSPLHKDTLHKLNPTRLCRRYPAGERHFGFFSGFSRHLDGASAGHPDLSEDQANTSLMLAVPPSLLIGGAGDYSSFVCLQPLGPERVRLRYGLMFFGDDWSGTAVEEAVALGRETMAEDRRALEGVQRGARSRFHQPGPLAPGDYEGTLLDLFQYLARTLLPRIGDAPGGAGVPSRQ